MPFEELETVPRDVRVPMASVSYERPPKGKLPRVPRLIVAIPTTISGMCKHDRFRIDVGTGADAGKARVTGVAKGVPGRSAPGTMLKHSLVIRFGHVPALGEDPAAKEACFVTKVNDNTWDVALPAWFRVEKAPAKIRAA